MIIDYTRAENRRKFFENYARKKGFDPLVAENWYSEPIHHIMASPVIIIILF